MFFFAFSLCWLLVTGDFAAEASRISYDNYKVYKATPSNAAELEVLKNLDGSSDSIMFLNGVHAVNRDVSVMVAPHKVVDFSRVMKSNGINFNVMTNNMQRILEAETKPVAKLAYFVQDAYYGWRKYHTLAETYKWLRELPAKYAGAASLIQGGKSYEGRPILGIKISKGKSSSKPGIFLEAGMHAREWIAPATVTYILAQLLSSNNAAVQKISQSYDWYIFPLTNPDGYFYTHTTDRLWRKTRARYGSCFGADPNRNWGSRWNTVGASNNSCSDNYAGPSEFSEIETKSLAQYIASLRGKLSLYISFHGFSQYLLYPFGHSATLPANHKDLQQVYDVTIAAIRRRYGTEYTGGNIHNAIYATSGTSIDWAYEKAGIKMAFCYELRPFSNASWEGFSLPAAEIIPTGEETLDSIVAMVNEVEKLGYFK